MLWPTAGAVDGIGGAPGAYPENLLCNDERIGRDHPHLR